MAPSKAAGAPTAAPPEMIARDALLAWFRGEFAAANAIIDALCNHLRLVGEQSEYDSVLASIHRRRLNWIPILQMQKHFSVADVAFELHQVSLKKQGQGKRSRVSLKQEPSEECSDGTKGQIEYEEEVEACFEDSISDPKRSSDFDHECGGFQDRNCSSDDVHICSDQKDCSRRPDRILTTKGFIANEPVKEHMVNVVKGLKVYENVCTGLEISNLILFINELRVAGQKGELSGETFLFFNNQLKGNRREIIQLGIPICGLKKEDTVNKSQKTLPGSVEPIPPLLKAIINHMVQWHLIPKDRRPNCCVINFFAEGDYSQPYLKPAHFDQPISTLFLSNSTMAFGRVLADDYHGNYKGSLMISIKEGSLVAMNGNSAEVARHAICASPYKRIMVTFIKASPSSANQIHPPVISLPAGAMALWQPVGPQVGPPRRLPISAPLSRKFIDMAPRWGVHNPFVLLAPRWPVSAAPWRMPSGGTGVFLPWRNNPTNSTNRRPPRQRGGRLPSLTSSAETKDVNHTPKSGDSE